MMHAIRNPLPVIVGALALAASAAAGAVPDEKMAQEKDTEEATKERGAMPALRFKMKDIDGGDRDLREFGGNVILIVNTASECGLTPQYEGLEKVYEEKKDQGFTLLAFPANNFGGQEPGTDEQIKKFCTETKYSVTFPLFSKVSVKGEDKCELFSYLTSKDAGHDHGGEIRWNFNKFLIGRTGEVIGRFSPMTKPSDGKLIKAVDEALAAPIPEGSALARQRAKDKEAAKSEGRAAAAQP